MAASSTVNSICLSNTSLVSARCTGFAKIKGTNNDFEYCIDLEWSDDRSMSIKRTYPEFQNLHNNLLKLFPELKRHSIKSRLRLQTYSLKDNVANLFTKDKGTLAESREIILDAYIRTLLKQPDRIRHSNLVISFFEPKVTDPKPCKSCSPTEKSDSGIDLSSSQQRQQVSRTRPEINDDYDGDTSGTETDNDPFDEEYMLDFGFGELMLHDSCENLQLSRSSDGGWCSNGNKLSNILSTLPTPAYDQRQYMQTMDIGQDDFKDIEDYYLRESSDTESQMFASQIEPNFSDGLESDDEFCCKKVTTTDMKHYYLSTNTLDTQTESSSN